MVTITKPEEQELDRTPDMGVERYASVSLREWRKENQADLAAGTLVPFLIKVGGKTVGFFSLGSSPEQVSRYTPGAQNAVVMRNFFIVPEEQGKGYGARVLKRLPKIVRARFPQAITISLAVNATNLSAIRAYKKAGFVDTKHFYEKSIDGPAHVFTLSLQGR